MIKYYYVLILIAAVQAIMLTVAMLGRQRESGSTHQWLIVLCTLTALTLIEGAMDVADLHRQYPHIGFLFWPTTSLFPPLLYGYIRHMVGHKPSHCYVWHFLPVFIIYFLFSPLILLDGETKVMLLYGNSAEPALQNWLFFTGMAYIVILSLQGLYYVPACMKRLIQYREELNQQLSYHERISLKWLFYFVIGFSTIWTLLIFSLLTGVENLKKNLVMVVHLGVALLIYSINIIALRQAAIFNQLGWQPGRLAELDRDGGRGSSNQATNIHKYQRSSLDDKLGEKVLGQLIEYMDTYQPYLDNTLSLPKLAKLTGLTTHHISQVINQYRQQNFFDFINSYRVQAAKKLLTQSKKSVLSVAMDVGFNSKSAFYAAFKKMTQMSPSDFKIAQNPNISR